MADNKMRAVVIDRFGGPETLTVRNIPVPEIAPDQILIRVGSAGVGIWDVAEREGRLAGLLQQVYGLKSSFPYVIGSEGAGTVVDVGEKVSNFRIGDRVYAEVFARDPKGGFYAEFTAVDATGAMPIPPNLTVEQAGALYIDGLVALRGLGDTLQMKPEEKLMIFGASGGIGHLAVQLARQMGVQVFAVASGEDGVALSRRLGASDVVEGHDHLAVEASAHRFAPNGFDAALITVRGTSPEALNAAEKALTKVREGGRVAVPWGNVMPTPKVPPNVKALSFGAADESRKTPYELLQKLNKMIQLDGNFEVHIGKTFPLNQVVEAHQALGSHYLGRLALLPDR
jgi:NADPH:quinone reductase